MSKNKPYGLTPAEQADYDAWRLDPPEYDENDGELDERDPYDTESESYEE